MNYMGDGVLEASISTKIEEETRVNEDNRGKKKLSIEELETRMWRDRMLLRKLKEERREREKGQSMEQLKKKTMSRAQDSVLKNMLKMMEICGVRGFVYGIIPEKGKPVSGASDNLRAWWKEKVKFDRNGPTAISRYDEESGLHGINDTLCGDSSSAYTLHDLPDTTLGTLQDKLTAKETAIWMAVIKREELLAKKMYPQMFPPPPDPDHDHVAAPLRRPNLFIEGTNYENEGNGDCKNVVVVVGEPNNTLSSAAAASNVANSSDNNMLPINKNNMPSENGANKRKADSVESITIPHEAYSCHNSQCPFHENISIGFNDRNARNNHQLTCQFSGTISTVQMVGGSKSQLGSSNLDGQSWHTSAQVLNQNQTLGGASDNSGDMLSDLMDIYTAGFQQKRVTSAGSGTSNMSIIPLGANQNVQPQMDKNFFGQRVGGVSGYKLPSQVSNVYANVSTSSDPLFDLDAFGSQSDNGATFNYPFMDSHLGATPGQDFLWLYN
ncbi:hypothetical protein VNO77_25887 [Canavalia gladiata]|uniref:Ethylene insensitive 3-like DNA-binding domain-containing protein n=1 Tax=Canavalia gladiata TaxID=3824 RepID=A0AAN9Q2Y3_CANGL